MEKTKSLNFSMGLFSILKGFKEIFTDLRVFLYTIIPLVIGLISMAYMFYNGWEFTTDWVRTSLTQYLGQLIPEKSFFFKSAFWILNLIAKLLVSILILFFGFVFIQIISIPFYSLVCERILQKRKVFPERPFRLATWLRTTGRLFVISIFRMSLFMGFGIVFFLISFIPGLHFIGLFYSALVMSFDTIDYTLEVYELGLGKRFSMYFDYFSFFIGLSITLIPSFFIPGLTIFLLPVTVVGTAVCYAETLGKAEYEKLIA